jgi:hypothetical protein
MMSRKDYVAIADVMADTAREIATADTSPACKTLALSYLRGITQSLAGVFAEDNPRFDPSRFGKACGGDK